MVEVGIRSILNFAPTILSVPEGVDVRRVDLSSELQILAYHEQRKSADRRHADRRGRQGAGMSVLVVGMSHKTAPRLRPRAGRPRLRGRAEADPRGLRHRARHRGDRALHLQPHRGLRRRRPVPRQRRGDLADAGRPRRPVGRGRAGAPLRALRRRRRLPPVPRRRRARLDGARREPDPRPDPRGAAGRPGGRHGRPRPQRRSSSRPCASASARTPRPTSTGSDRASSRPRWTGRPSTSVASRTSASSSSAPARWPA